MIAQLLRYRFFLPALFVIALGVAVGFYVARAADGEVISYQKTAEGVNGFGSELDPGDYFGLAVASIGDLNGNGVTDLAIGSPGDDDGDGGNGAVYILFLDSDGTLDTSTTGGAPASGYQKISDTVGDFDATFGSGMQFGSAIAALGDLNGDGVEDIAVGSPAWFGEGIVHILFLETSGVVSNDGMCGCGYVQIADTEIGLGIFDSGDAFGSDIGVGDVNNNGVVDLLIGAPGDDTDGTDRGAVYVAFLNTAGSVVSATVIDSNDLSTPLEDSDAFGTSVSAIGDLNSLGAVDFAVGAVGDDDGGSGRGAVYILFMNTNGTVASDQKISDTAGGFTATLDNFDQFGVSVANLGDINSDGVVELAVGANSDGDGGSARGAVYILFMDTDGTLNGSAGASGDGYTKISSTATNFTSALDDDDFFGVSVSSLGDLDGDGNRDLVAGANADDDGGPQQGAIYTLFLEGGDGTSPTAGGGGAITATPSFFTMDLSWTAATDNVTSASNLVYKVYQAAAGADLDSVADIEANGTLVSTQTGGDVTYTLVNLQPNTTYTYNVIVSDEADNKTAYTQGSTATLYPSQAPTVHIERPYFNIRGDECTWDRNIVLEVGGKNIQSVIVADNAQFLNASWQSFKANTTISTSSGPVNIMEIKVQLPRAYGTYQYFALVKSATGETSRTMLDSIELTSRANCTYPSRQRVPYFGRSDAELQGYYDAIDKAMDIEEEIEAERKAEEEANEASLVYVQGVKAGDLVKLSNDPALYYVAKVSEPTDVTTGLTRHAFPNEQIFSTWYNIDDMKRAKIVSTTTMDRIPLKGPMPPKEGSTLIQFQNDTTIYLPQLDINAKPNTTPYNITLRPITTAGLTEELFGRDYKQQILTLPESLKPQMTLGRAITKFDASVSKLKNTMKRW